MQNICDQRDDVQGCIGYEIKLLTNDEDVAVQLARANDAQHAKQKISSMQRESVGNDLETATHHPGATQTNENNPRRKLSQHRKPAGGPANPISV